MVNMRKPTVLFVALFIHCVRVANAVPLSSFYEYSSSSAVTCLPTELDDGHSNVTDLTTPFSFFGVPQTTAYVNTNGVVSFGAPEDRYTSQPFPIDGTPLLTPFWGDVDTSASGSGDICYQLTDDAALLSRAREDILAVSPTHTFFNPTQLLIATWDHVAPFPSSDNPGGLTNTFQCILITDGTHSFVIFLYADGLIQWSVGSASTVHAQAGFNAGVDGGEFTIAGSQTEAIVNIDLTSNVGVPGKYLFRVDNTTISATPPPLTPDTSLPSDIIAFVSEPANVTLIVNAMTQIRCSAYVSSLYPNLTLSWINKNTNTTPSEDDGFSFHSTSVETGGIQFVVSVLSFSGSAVTVSYPLACVAQVLTATSSSPFTLSVVPETATVTIEGPSQVPIGTNLSISCHAITNSFTLVHFIHNGTIITRTGDSGISITTGASWSNLTVYNADRHNAGTYSCLVNTGGEGGTAVAELNVTVREEFPAIRYFAISTDGNVNQVLRNETTVAHESSVVITCNASGIPDPELVWKKDSEPVDYTLTSSVPSVDYYTVETLSIESVVPEDSGVYTCIATNQGGTVGASTQLHVVVGAYITDPPNNTTVHVGLNATFQCVATSDPPHRTLWMFGGSQLVSGDKYVITDVSAAVSELVIVNVTAGDAGEYTCDVDNDHGDDMDTATLTVISTPVVTAITQSPYIVVSGGTAVLSFQVESDIHAVTLSASNWRLTNDEEIIAEDQRFTFSEDFTSLAISPVHVADEGTYTLTATNNAGLTGSGYILLVVQSPSAIESSPSNTTVVIADSVSLSCTASGIPPPSITWYRPGGGEIVNATAYTVSGSEDHLTRSVLTILAAAQADTGQYNCTAANSLSTDSATFYIQVHEPPEITELVFRLGPEVVVGNEAQMQCTAFGVPAPDISWEAGGIPLISTFNSTGNSSTSTLTLSTVSLSDSGPFTCTADNGVVSAASATLNLTVLFPPTASTGFTNLEVVVGENATLTCSASGLPIPLITWTVPDAAENQTIISSTVVNETFTVSRLTILSVQQSHTGLYACRAENSIDYDSSSVFLQVLEPAEVLRHTDNTTATIADSVSLYCEASGVHRPTVVWTRGNDIISNSSRVTILESVGSNGSVISTLAIDVLTRSDAGVYSCSVSNSAGDDKVSIELIVQEPALVVVYPENTVVLAGDTVLLTCVGTGLPSPALVWRKNERDITGDSSKFSVTESVIVVENTVFVRSSLLLCNASELDIGEYSCTADNAVEEPVSENFTITVRTISPVVLMYSNDASATIQSTVSLSCTVFGAPAPTVTWSFNGTELTTDNSQYIVQKRSVMIGALYLAQSVLHICGVSVPDGGNYTCSADSYAGTTAAIVGLSIEVPVSIALVANDTSLYVGETAVLSCVAHGLPLPVIFWSRDGQPLRDPFLLTESELVMGHVTFVRSTLHFCSAILPDDGKYACVATNNLTIAQETFTLNINVEPQVVIFPNNSEFFAGSTLRLSCTAYGIPLPLIKWSKTGYNLQKAAITSDSRVDTWEETLMVGEHRFVRSHLQICSTMEGDSGLYSCTSVTSERENGVQFGVTVIGVPPTLVKTPEDVSIVAEMGESVVATCIAFGSPAPSVSWSLQPDSEEPAREGAASESGNTSLTVTIHSSIRTDQLVRSGVGIVYSTLLLCPGHPALLATSLLSCTARNGVGGGDMMSHSFHINVSVEPEVKDEHIEHIGFVGETVSLTCTADGVPLPDITWLKDDCPLTRHIELSNWYQITERVIMGIRPHVPEARESVLVLANSRERDTGAYSCRATNELNTAYLPVAHHVTVNALPVVVDVCGAVTLCQNGGMCVSRGGSFSCMCLDGWIGPHCEQRNEVLSAPVLLNSPQTTFAQLLTDVELECDVTGNPEPLTTWYKDGLEIKGATQRRLTLVEVDLYDRAAYHCTAQNSLGNIASDEAYLNIRGLAQYAVSVNTSGTDLSAVDKLLDATIEEMDIVISGDGTVVTVLCVEPFVQSTQGDWGVVLTLLSVNGDNLELAQVMEDITSIFAGAGRELDIDLQVEAITRYDGCPENVTEIVSNSTSGFELELVWPEQPYGGLVELQCPCDAASLPLTASRQCAGSFEGGVEWAEPEDSQCHFSEMTNMLCSLPDTDQLSVLTSNPEELGTLDVFLVAVNIKLATNETLGNSLMSDNVLDTIDHLLSLPAEVLVSSQEQFNSTSIVLEGLRQVIDNYPLPSTPPLKLFQETFSVVVEFDFDPKTFGGTTAEFTIPMTVTSSSNHSIVKRDDTATVDPIDGDIVSSISLSNELAPVLEGLRDPRIEFVMYTTVAPFTEREEVSINTTLAPGSMVVVEARVSGGGAVSDIEDLVTIIFPKNEFAVENGSMSVCVFWNQTLDEGYGGWSEDGCQLLREDDRTAVCTCDLLGIFFLLVDTLPIEAQPSEDRDIGPYVYTGSVFSAVCFFLTITIYLFTRSQWKTVTGILLLNSCTSLLLLNLSFVAAYYSARFSETACHTVSAIFHYLFLASVFSLAGLAFTRLEREGAKDKRKKKYSAVVLGLLVTWCLPAVAVALSLGLSQTYNDCNTFCRPVEEAFHYGLILPWALTHLPIYLCQFFLPCPHCMNTLRKHVRRSWIREYTGIFLMLVLFDIGWGFGLPATHPLYIGSLRFYGQIVFTCANGCMGIVLLVFFCITSKEVRRTCIVKLLLNSLRQNSVTNWQRESGLYKEDSGSDDKEAENVGVGREENEEIPVITFQYDLNEVYGNPAAMTPEEVYAFESETQFS